MQLRVLCCNPDGGAFLYITRGWENAFKTAGHNFLRWNGQDDVLRSFRPNIYLGCSGWRQNCPSWAKSQFGTKIAIHVNPYGSSKVGSVAGGPQIDEKQDIIEWVKEASPDALFCYAMQNEINKFWNKWQSIVQVPIVSMPTAADSIHYAPTSIAEQYKCDIGFIGGLWQYKGINIRKYLFPVLQRNDLNCKVYGWSSWPMRYCGKMSDADDCKLFSSAKVCPTIVEPHTSVSGIDWPERIFKIAACGSFAVSDPIVNFDNYLDRAVFPMANNPEEYLALCCKYTRDETSRTSMARKQRQEVLAKHTYLHRISGLLQSLGHINESKEMIDLANHKLNEAKI